MMNKKGMEFSVNALVAIVLGLFMFITGMVIFYNLYDNITETPTQIDDRMRDEILSRFDDGSRIYIHQNSKRMDNDGRAIYYVAINNLLNKNNFSIITENLTINLTTVSLSGEVELKPNEKHIFMVILDGRRMTEEQGSALVNVTINGHEYATRIIYLNK